MNNQQLSKQGRMLIIEREGVQKHKYLDSAGLPTIGAGHLLTKSELSSGKIQIGDKQVCWRDGLTNSQIAVLLDQDADHHETAINQLVIVPLEQYQFDALVSFSFNVGIGAFKRSTLLKLLNRGYYDDVPKQMQRWKYSNGRIIKGLINRRASEIKQWSNGYVN